MPHIHLPRTPAQTALLVASHWIWARRGAAKAAGFPFAEETITETVLLDIADVASGHVSIVPFNKQQEGAIGADWEWCFYDQRALQYLRLLMQAKVLDNNDHQYAHIDRYVGNSDVRQIDRLKDSATSRGVPALYAFYNHLSDEKRVPAQTCACEPCTKCWGASVAPLHAVLNTLPDKKFDTLKNSSFPWVCLLCPARAQGTQVEDVLSSLRALYQRARDARGGAMIDELPLPDEPAREPPAYLRELLALRADGDRPAERQRRLNRLAAENPDIDGIVAIDVSLPD
jgi:hypothetical protein